MELNSRIAILAAEVLMTWHGYGRVQAYIKGKKEIKRKSTDPG